MALWPLAFKLNIVSYFKFKCCALTLSALIRCSGSLAHQARANNSPVNTRDLIENYDYSITTPECCNMIINSGINLKDSFIAQASRNSHPPHHWIASNYCTGWLLEDFGTCISSLHHSSRTCEKPSMVNSNGVNSNSRKRIGGVFSNR